jgi:hypothetical protein
MLAAPAYTEVGRPLFLEYRGEWALIAFFATMSPTLGQTNFVYVSGVMLGERGLTDGSSVFRVLGTL